jgi:hypothetical protein
MEEGHSLVLGDEIMRWIIEDDVDNTISQLGRLMGRTSSESKAFSVTSSKEIEEFNKMAGGLRKELVAVGVFDDGDLDMSLVDADAK